MAKKVMPAPGLKPSAATYVTSSLTTLGYTQRTLGYWVHGLQWAQLGLFPWPAWMLIRLMKWVEKKNYEYALKKNKKST